MAQKTINRHGQHEQQRQYRTHRHRQRQHQRRQSRHRVNNTHMNSRKLVNRNRIKTQHKHKKRHTGGARVKREDMDMYDKEVNEVYEELCADFPQGHDYDALKNGIKYLLMPRSIFSEGDETTSKLADMNLPDDKDRRINQTLAHQLVKQIHEVAAER